MKVVENCGFCLFFPGFCGCLAPLAHFEQLGFCWHVGLLWNFCSSRENNIFLLYPLSPTLIHHSLTQHVHHGHHAALANNWRYDEMQKVRLFNNFEWT